MNLGKLIGPNTGPAQSLAGAARGGGGLWANLAQSMVRSGIVGKPRNPNAQAPLGPMNPDNLWNSFAGVMMRQNMQRNGTQPPMAQPQMPPMAQNPTQQPATPVQPGLTLGSVARRGAMNGVAFGGGGTGYGGQSPFLNNRTYRDF
jgi:hypothetical protein